jgi:hypothetical protein
MSSFPSGTQLWNTFTQPKKWFDTDTLFTPYDELNESLDPLEPLKPIVEPPKITEKIDVAAKVAAEAEAAKLRKRKGLKSTILTGPEGLMTPAQTQKAELLG